MFDIGFFEIALIGVVLLVVMGPERLPEVARQGAFFIRKIRGWMYDMKSEMDMGEGSHMESLREASREIADLKTDIAQFGDDLAGNMENATDKVDDFVSEVSGEALDKKEPVKKTVTKKAASPKKTTAKKKSPVKAVTAKKAPAKKRTTAKKTPAKAKAKPKKTAAKKN